MYAGIDAGGTKTDICLVDECGRVTAREITGGINAARDGFADASVKLEALLRRTGADGARSVYLGVAGAGSPEMSAALQARLETSLNMSGRVMVRSDAFNALNTVCGLDDGIALIAGTGSSAFVRIGGTAFQVGGRGYLIDDAGSGYWVGRACLNAVFRQLDGRGPETMLTGAVGMDIAAGIPEIYEKGPAYIAGFAPLVFECARQNDAVALGICGECMDELELHLKACLKIPGAPDTCVFSGGMTNSPLVRNALERRAEKLGLNIVYPTIPPVCGAAIAAAAMDGVDLKGKIYGL